MTSSMANVSSSNLNNNNNGNQMNEVAVKVAVRVRPLNNREKLHQHQPCVRIASDTNQLVIGKDKVFSFDYVLPPKTSQNDLYQNCVKSLVNGLFDGYNATVFAYGQTGSGKTHTISGCKTTVDDYGIIPRAVETIFQIINTSQKINQRDYIVKVNFIEIYKEELKDLLDSSEKDLQIREDEQGNTIIYGANEVSCSSLEEVMACFDSGTLLRHTGSTNMNEQSSRSHSVFTVCVEQRWSDSKSVRESAIYDLRQTQTNNSYYLGAKFHFVDLAGSERVQRTGNVGDRFKESIHINSGLLALGNVISALSSDANQSKKKVHIPYRESKITRILKDSLGGNSNTLMICCVSPSSCNLDESINALKYASRARYIKNKPIVNMDPEQQKFVEMQSEIQALREELSRQRTVISEANVASNDEELKVLAKKFEQAQNESDFFRKLVKEAFNRFKQVNLNLNNVNMVKKLSDEWLEIFEASKNRSDFDVEDFTKQKLTQLEAQLKQAQDDLKSDEEIFADKENEINTLKELVNDLEQKLTVSNRCLEQSLSKEKEQQELMLQLQLQLDNLISHNKIDNTNDLSSNTSGYKSLSTSSKSIKIVNQRAKTAPVDETTKKANPRQGAYSTPVLSSNNLERFMQNFRARSQLLTETLEENDCVLQNNLTHKFNSTFSVNEEEEQEEQIDDLENVEGQFVRKGTYKVPKNKPNQNDTKLRDMSLNIKMKEELIKELVANSKLTSRINLQSKQKIDLLEKEIAQYKSEILDLQKQLQAKPKGQEQPKTNSDKKLADLEIAYSKLKQQNDLLQKRIKEDSERKLKLEKDYEKEQQKLKDLEMKSEKQQQILKKKTEDLVVAHKRLRSASQSGPDSEQQQRAPVENTELELQLDEQRKINDELKQVLEIRLSEQKLKSEKIVKLLQQQLNDSNSRIVLLEREIDSYREKIIKLKQRYQEHNLESESVINILNSHREGMNGGDGGSSVKSIKMSRKDLRPLTQEELIKRSLNKQSINSINENNF
ncbi:unnamed protein product [Brachionus calyciflorus]|uniref:Kinesin motor domain-containing protein n=1 Tax=Brachionus calyciflorus TaxID=104777 RepID=A0A813YC65_9BILA|nr:unnamed protein product [Brachionus calyciflorus]